MRLIGHLENESLAERVSGVLLSQGIHNQVEPDEGLRWAVWVHGEEDLEKARQLLAAFRANPDDPAFRARTSSRVGAGAGGESGRRRARVIARPAYDGEAGEEGIAGLTIGLLVLCGAVALITGLTGEHGLVRRMQISGVPFRLGMSWEVFLPEVRKGEIWRLFTPALLHFGWPHLLFNLWAFWDLGRLLERRRGSGSLLALVLVLGVVSNLGQYLANGPRFGGMSGVIYGLLGYAWMLGRYRPSAGVVLHPQTVLMMLVWFFICWSGALGIPVANAAHGVGLVAGVVWGRWAAWRGS